MGMRFRRSVKLAPGVKLNLTKTGVGMTFGLKGAHYSVHSSGRRTTSYGLPGTGYYQSVKSGATQHSNARPASGGRRPARQVPQVAVPIDPTRVIPKPGLFANPVEKAYYRGAIAYLRHDIAAARVAFEEVLRADPTCVSAYLFVGLAAAMVDDDASATRCLETVVASATRCPTGFRPSSSHQRSSVTS